MAKNISDFRKRVVEVLALIAAPDAQLEYQRHAPDINISAELFNQWDDTYHPEDANFCAQFNRMELAALRRFADIVDQVANETPQELSELVEFMRTEQWRCLSSGARDTAASLSGDRDGEDIL